ncbi:PA2169 family four-helix-bundle protein [Lignipirellula cremea]|uniref:DUF2383 domain-containing protein n=1 Tax=Lignipirellula cremea TaxID=2528010 RepID=A0A518DST4_9BACT|nr:PA2169 family four-helix-bundle protein [Lignipirellula cremea]QDU94900.1 hypothetical protein Pla8534_27080 [Lignipirellula cremea]
MATSSSSTIKEKVIHQVQRLIRANIDSHDRYQQCAAASEDSQIRQILLQLANERAGLANDLKNYVSWNGQEPVEEGTFGARVHRAWIRLRSRLNGSDLHVILAEADRGDAAIQKTYRKALELTEGDGLQAVLLSQVSCIQSGRSQLHEVWRALRDRG